MDSPIAVAARALAAGVVAVRTAAEKATNGFGEVIVRLEMGRIANPASSDGHAS